MSHADSSDSSVSSAGSGFPCTATLLQELHLDNDGLLRDATNLKVELVDNCKKYCSRIEMASSSPEGTVEKDLVHAHLAVAVALKDLIGIQLESLESKVELLRLQGKKRDMLKSIFDEPILTAQKIVGDGESLPGNDVVPVIPGP